MKRIIIIFTTVLLVVAFTISITSCKTVRLEQKPFDRSGISIIFEDKEVKVGEVIWKVESAEVIGSQITDDIGGILDTRFGRFIKVEFTTENTGDDIKTIVDLKVIDSKGREFPICAEAYSYAIGGIDESCLLTDIYPGEKDNFTAYFDTPLNSVDLILEVSDLGFPPGEKAYIDLGI